MLKYIDNEIIKNRDYNTRYGLKRKVVVVIDEAHVFIDTKFPVALDFMFQLAKRIRKYNGMQIVITQNIKDFVGSEEIARKSSAIINACQYSFVFGLAPNDMEDLCRLYAKAGGINEQEQEDILGAKRGQAFTIMSPTSRSSFQIEVPSSMVDMFENKNFESNYFSGEEGAEVWEDFVAESREAHDANFEERKLSENSVSEVVETHSSLTFSEITEEEIQHMDYESDNIAADEGKGRRKSAVEMMMEAEEAVNTKEYEMAVGRFGGINFSETDGDDYDNEQTSDGGYDEGYGEGYGENYGGISFSEISGDDYDSEQAAGEGYDESFGKSFDDNRSDNRNAGGGTEHGRRRDVGFGRRTAGRAGTDAGMQTQGSVDSMAYIEETLESFKASVRAEMDKELEERIKWISLGAGIGAGNAVGTVAGGVGVMAEGLQQTDRANVAQTSSGMTEGGIGGDYPADEDYSSEKSYDDDFGFDDEDSGTLFEDDSEYESGVQFEDEAEEESDIEFEDDGSEDEDFELPDDEFFFDDDDTDYDPAPFVFAELLDSMAEEYADMDLEQKMEDIGELVIEVTLEELAAYVKKNRKK